MKTFDKIIHINELICKETTGNAYELGKKIEKSRASVFTYIAFMKKHGAPIHYCKLRRTYYYKSNEKYKLSFCKIS